MPCFLSGVAAANAVAATSNIPMYTFSHQCGHVMAALVSCGNESLQKAEAFGAFHVSGGTTEVLSVRVAEKEPVSQQGLWQAMQDRSLTAWAWRSDFPFRADLPWKRWLCSIRERSKKESRHLTAAT